MTAAVATATADCPDCAGHLTCTASGRGDGHTARCVLRCDDCSREWLLVATLTRISGREVATPAKRAQLARARQAVTA